MNCRIEYYPDLLKFILPFLIRSCCCCIIPPKSVASTYMLESNRTPQQQSTSIGVQTHAYGLVFQDFDVIFWINSHKLHVHVVYCYIIYSFSHASIFESLLLLLLLLTVT